MGGTPDAPQPSEQEKRAFAGQARAVDLAEQTIRQQGSEEDPLRDILFKLQGVTPKFNTAEDTARIQSELAELQSQLDNFRPIAKGGKRGRKELQADIRLKEAELKRYQEGKHITGYDMAPDEFAQARDDITKQYYDRVQAGLRGELPVDPALLRGLEEEQLAMNEILRKNLGPGYETSTPGLEAMANFGQRRQETLYDARMNDIGFFQDAANISRAADMAETGARLGGITDISGLPLRRLFGMGNIGSQYGNLGQTLAQARLSAPRGGGGDMGNIFGAVGMGLGALAAPFTGGASLGGVALGAGLGGGIGSGLGSLFRR